MSAAIAALAMWYPVQGHAQQTPPTRGDADQAPDQAPDQANAPADAGLSEIIVTAQKREQRLQDVPVAVTALDSDVLTANRVTTARDLDALVPNLMVRQQFGASGLPIYTIRGALASSTAAGADRGVATYIDGVYLATANGALFELADVERIEVLRGPQGTLFGRNATGGAISFVTREPSDQFSARETATLGNLGQIRSVTNVQTGAFGPFSASFSYLHSQINGDIRNLRPGIVWNFGPSFSGRNVTARSPKRLGDVNSDAVAAALKFEPNDSFKAVYRFDWSDMDMTGEGIAIAYARPAIRALLATQDPALMSPITRERPDAVNNGNMTPSHLRASGHNLTVQYRLSDSITLKNILAYRQNRFDTLWTDISGVGVLTNTGAPIFAAFLGPALANATIGAPLLVQATTAIGTDKQLSNELQLNYSGDLLTLTTGALFFQNKQLRSPAGEETGLGRPRSGAYRVYPGFVVPFAGQPGGTMGRATRVTTRSYAVFGQAEVHLTPQLDVSGGVRYTRDKRKGLDQSNYSALTPVILPISYDGDKITYSVGVNFKPSRDILIYAKYGTGFISGGSLASIAWVPEVAKSLEAGIKATWFDNRLRTNLAVFDVRYQNIQATLGGSVLTPPRPEITLAVANVGDAKARGFELETELVPTRALHFSAGVGYTDFKFTKILPLFSVGNAEVRPQNRPKWTLNLSGRYESDPLFENVTLLARVDANWRSKFYPVAQVPIPPATSVAFSAAEQDIYRAATTIQPYWLVNGRIGLQGFDLSGAKADISLWAKNLLDEKTPSYALTLVNVVGYQFEKARTFGIDVDVRF